jgi:hypothetical protein
MNALAPDSPANSASIAVRFFIEKANRGITLAALVVSFTVATLSLAVSFGSDGCWRLSEPWECTG